MTENDSRPKSDNVVTKRKRQMLQLLLDRKKTQLSTVIVGIFIVAFLLSVSVICIVLAAIYDKRDLYIVGGIFMLGLVTFGVMFTFANCRPWIRNRKIHAMIEKQADDMEKSETVNKEPTLTEEDMQNMRIKLDTL